MTKRDDGGPAFPLSFTDFNGQTGPGQQTVAISGMSLRDYFAGQVMQGMVGRAPVEVFVDGSILKTTAGAAYEIADAMIEARKR